jgi:Caspase domain
MEITPIPLQNDINTEGGQYHALFIGIDNYKNKNNFPSLGCAVNDASALMEVLTKKYTFNGQIKLLKNETADYYSIDKELRALRNPLKIKKEDSILIFFAGHGQYDENDREGYIIPYDGKSNFENCFSYGNIVKKYLSNIECKNIALILDCCNAGEIFNEPIKKDDIRCDSIFLFAASRKDEYAHEGIKNSPFTENIVKIFNSNIEEKILVTVLSSRIEDIFLSDKHRERYPQCPIGSYLNPSRKGDGFIFFSQNTEESAWQKAIHEHTFEAYNTFKLNYPESKYPVEVKITLIEKQTHDWQIFIKESLSKIEEFTDIYKEGQNNYLNDAEKLKIQLNEISENLNKKRIIEQDLGKLTSQSSIEDWENVRNKHFEHPEFKEYIPKINDKVNFLKKKSQAEKDWTDRKAKISREQKPKIVRDLCASYLEEHGGSNASSEIYKKVKNLIDDAVAYINAQEDGNYASYLENWKNTGHFVKDANAKRLEQIDLDEHEKSEKQRQDERMILNEITSQKDYLELINFIQNEPLIKDDAHKYLNQWEAHVKQEIEKINKNAPIHQLENFIEDYQDYPQTKEVRNWIEERDIETYDLARTSRDIILLKLYLGTFINGEYRGLAKDLIEEIEQEEIENLKNIDEKTLNTVFEREAQDLTENQDLELVESILEDNYIPTIIEDNQNEVENTTSKTVVDDSDLNDTEILNSQTDIEINSEVIKTLDDSELVDDSNRNNEMDTSLVNDYEEQGLGIDKKDDINHGISTNKNIVVSEKIQENSIGLAFLFILCFILLLIVILYYFLNPILR